MPNFFTDNNDLVHHFQNLNLKKIVSLKEHDFSDSKNRDDAPRDYTEAMDNYSIALDILGNICGSDIAPRRLSIDAEGTTLKEGKVSYAHGTNLSKDQLSEAGFMGTMYPREYGGLNFPATIYMMMIEMVSQADASLMTLFGYQDVGELIARFGSHEQCQEFLPKLASGDHIGAIVLSEPGAGSDLQSIKLKADLDDNGNWHLNGIKHFISNGSGDVLMVLARSEPGERNPFGLSLFVCPGSEAVVVNRVEEKMGLHGSPTCELSFKNAPAQLVGSRRIGLTKYILESLNQARFSVAAQSIGIAEAAYQEAISYSKIRSQFGSLICEFPAVANLLFEIRVKIESSRALLYEGVQWLDLKTQLEELISELKLQKMDVTAQKKELQDATNKVNLLSPMVKYIATEAANQACYDAQQVFGGMGYMKETGIEQLVRDVRITSIYEGTSQVQIAASLKLVMSDILQPYFCEMKQSLNADSIQSMVNTIDEIREIFLACLEYLKEKDDSQYNSASAKNLVDIYGTILAGYLLLSRVEKNEQKRIVASRYINNAKALAHANSVLILSGQYDDLKQSELLTNPAN